MSALSELNGLEWARAERELNEVAFTGDVSKEAVEAAIRDAGFKVGG